MDHYSNDRFARRGIMNHSNEPSQFKLHSEYQPTGDQPQAIAELVEGFRQGNQFETLLGVTGSGKTFTMANVIQALNKPTLIIAHNKTLAGQLYGEMKEFFPENAVEYFVSYYDYYQPEAYVPSSDTYIAKDSSINDEIDKLRLSATASLAERRDVVVVASVSCIYGLGSPDEYQDLIVSLRPGMVKDRDEVLRELIDIQYNRNDMDIQRATFRVRGDVVEVYPAQGGDYLIRIEFFGDEIDRIAEVEPLTGKIHAELNHVAIFPASHYVVSQEKIKAACDNIEEEMKERVQFFKGEDKLIEAQRIAERTNFDIEMLRETGFCSGIETDVRTASVFGDGRGKYKIMTVSGFGNVYGDSGADGAFALSGRQFFFKCGTDVSEQVYARSYIGYILAADGASGTYVPAESDDFTVSVSEGESVTVVQNGDFGTASAG